MRKKRTRSGYKLQKSPALFGTRCRVFPIKTEKGPIQVRIKQDGTTKNDCERNAGHRLLEKIRREHPRLKLIVIEDGLSSNGPHIEELLRHRMSFLLGPKPGDHAYLFNKWIEAHDSGEVTTLTWALPKGNTGELSFTNNLPLNASHEKLRVNFLEYLEQQFPAIRISAENGLFSSSAS